MLGKVFISYRRDDSAGYAGRVHDRLVRDLGVDLLFMDVDSIDLGINFAKVLQDEVAKCEVLLAVIGPHWLVAQDDDGQRRLDNPNDFVRIEIAAALQRDIPVIPVLLDGAKVPKASQLPSELKELALRNALEVRHTSFHSDMDRLIAFLTRRRPGQSITKEIENLRKQTEAETVDEPQSAPVRQVPALQSEEATASNPPPPIMVRDIKRSGPASGFRLAAGLAAILLVAILAWTAGKWWAAGEHNSSNGLARQGDESTRRGPDAMATATRLSAPTISNPPSAASGEPNSPSSSTVADAPLLSTSPDLSQGGNDPGANVVRGFYTALGRGDGAAAAKFVAPERQTGHFDPQGMTKFFSSFKIPLQLISVVPYGQNSYQATYTYMATTKVCNNSVVVALMKRNGEYLIQSIDSHGGC
jgi:hypothetical protein